MEPRHLIAMSLGKIQACRGKRGGPSLHKSLMVSAILYKARNILMNDIYIHARKVEMLEEEKQRLAAEKQQNSEISEIVEPPRPMTPLPSAETPASHATETAKKPRLENTCDKENNPPTPNTPEVSASHTETKKEEISNMEYRDSSDSSKCAKRRLSESCDNEIENIPPKRIRSDTPATESTDNNNGTASQECTQQISCLVQRFNSGLNGLFASQKCNSSPLQDNQGHNDVVSNCCATQLSKDAAFSEQISRPVIALTV